MAAVAAVVVAADRAVRSAGNSGSDRSITGAAAMRPRSYPDCDFWFEGFTPMASLPIIAALGGDLE